MRQETDTLMSFLMSFLMVKVRKRSSVFFSSFDPCSIHSCT